MKRLLSVFWVALLVIGFVFTAMAEETVSGTCGENLTWEYDETTGTLTIDGTGSMNDFSTSRPWKEYEGEIQSVVIGDGVTNIGAYAFYNFDVLTSVTIGKGVTSIRSNAFATCEALSNIEIPDGVTDIGEYAFRFCVSLSSIEIPDSVTSIGVGAFQYCNSLSSVTIGKNVADIGFDTLLGKNAFSFSKNISGFSVDSENAVYSSDENGVLFNKDKTELIIYPSGNKRTSYEIPDSVTTIAIEAFYNSGSLESIAIGDNITSIGRFAFNNTSVYNNGANWENDVLYIGNYLIKANGNLSGVYSVREGTRIIADSAFEQCTNLTNVLIPDSVTAIGKEAFCYCSGLESAAIGNGVKIIGDGAFLDCTGITGELVIPDSVKSVGSGAFEDCLITSVKIGSGLESIGSDDFPYNHLESIIVSKDSPYLCTEDNVVFSKDKSIIFKYPMTKQGNYILPDSVKVIKSYAFSGFKGKLMINTVLDEIEHNAFASVVLSDRTLCSVYFMAGQPLLSYTDSFEKPYIYLYYYSGNGENWIFDEDGLWNGYDVYPYEDGETVEFDPSLYVASGYCGDNFGDGKNLAWMIDENGTLTIKGKGHMRDYGYKKFHTGEHDITDAPWSDYYYDVNKLVIEDGVMGIGNNAFFVMNTLKGELIIPDSVKRIGESAFRACSGFEGELVIPEGIKDVGSMAFYGAYGFSSLKLPSSFIGTPGLRMGGLLETTVHKDNKQFCSVDGVVFSKDMKKLIAFPEARTGSYTVPETVETIDANAFYESLLSEIILPAGYTENFKNSVFYNAEKLESLKYHEDNEKYCSVNGAVLTKDGKTFLYVPKGKTGSYTVPDTVETIVQYAFRYTCLSEIIIPESVKTIQRQAISINTDSLLSVIVKSGGTEMNSYFARVLNNENKHGINVYFLNGEPELQTGNNFVTGLVNLYYLAGTEDKWTFDDNGLWNRYTVTKFYGFGVEDSTDHSTHNTEIRNESECTCTDYGYTGDKFCADCGFVYEVGNTTAPCHKHTLATVVEPTCTEDGYITYICECGDTYTVDSNATGHSVNGDGVCDNCGELIEEPTALDRIIKILENIFASIIKFFISIFNFLYGILGNIL